MGNNTIEVLFENEYCKLGYHEKLRAVILKWKPFTTISFEDYKLPFNKLIAFNETTQVDNYIADALDQGVISPQFRKWFQENTLEKGLQNGLKRAVFITNANIFKKYYINHIMNSTKKLGLPFKIMSNMTDAIKWLKSFD